MSTYRSKSYKSFPTPIAPYPPLQFGPAKATTRGIRSNIYSLTIDIEQSIKASYIGSGLASACECAELLDTRVGALASYTRKFGTSAVQNEYFTAATTADIDRIL